MQALIIQLIRAWRGCAYETVGTISGFFDHPLQARGCALQIEAQMVGSVELNGCNLTVIPVVTRAR